MFSFFHIQAGLPAAPLRVPGTNQLWAPGESLGCDIWDQNLWEFSHKPGQNINLLLKMGQFHLVLGFSLHKSQINKKVDMTFVTACPC